MELQPLPEHLRYAYLGEASTYPVIVSAKLSKTMEEKLLRVLRKHKAALKWVLEYIKGISPFICTHKILLEDEVKPIGEHQRRLNPVARPRPASMAIFICLFVLRSRHLVFHYGLVGNPSVLVFVRDSRVRDWLWLGKGYQPWDMPPWLKQLHYSLLLTSLLPLLSKPLLMKKAMNSCQGNETISKFKMNISDSVIGLFCNFVIKPPDKL